ncbi:glycoside hydrolase family 79 protein [Crucibulum laeve]|uniref:Glycoside hydrolase family 79 protein n=1 Tax=Crucibulum laeve TaxID=68775 RepID=A0A5C3LJN6_9AGAR|nr:glycoside hydrolase family 79 protein [Crucibulum laeve]
MLLPTLRLLPLLLLPLPALSAITVHGQIPIAQTSTTPFDPAVPAVTTLAAYNDTILVPPPVPDPIPATSYTISMPREASAVQGLSIPHVGAAFWGFSIEMSVINQVLGKNSSLIQVPFLNLMQNLVKRAGSVVIRLGGNTQERAALVDEIENYSVIAKEQIESGRTTRTPAVVYSMDMFYLANNISQLTNVKWFMGIPFNDSVSWRLQIAEHGQTILGDNLLGLQAGNEPDFYSGNGVRESTYSPWDYFGEVGTLIETIDANVNIPNKNMLIAPSLGGGGRGWFPEQIWDTGFLTTYVDRLYALTVEHYPNNNCFVQFGVGSLVVPQEVFSTYLRHSSGKNLIAPYLNSTMLAQTVNKPFIMFETNSASCGGFQGISDSYGAALWALDYGLQMAHSNFTNALMHVGGQNVFYNPFTAPPTNQTSFNEWTIGAIYYSALVAAEVFGKTNTSRIIDIAANEDSIFTPAYAIYEEGTFSKMALFNYIDDPSGASDLTVSISVPNAGVPGSVRVKYLEASSVSVKNISWAGQTFGGKYEVDGRLKGDLNIVTIQCDQAANACQIPVRAPGFALVFMRENDAALEVGQATQTFPTTVYTKGRNTATVDPAVLATSNGHSEKDRLNLGSTSHGSMSGAFGREMLLRGAMVLLVGMMGSIIFLTGMLR